MIHRVPAWVVNGITVTLGLALVQCAIGFVAGAQAAQVAIATAVCASLADVVASTDRVARRVLVAVIGSTVSATLFLALKPFSAALVPAVTLIVFVAMLLLSWGPKAGSVAFATTLSLVFVMSVPATHALTWDRFAWGLAGSMGYWAWAVVTAWLLQPTWRNFALASSAEGLADLLAAVARQIGHPVTAAWQSGILDQEAALADRLQAARDLVFGNDAGPRARLETALLLHLIDLRDLAMASNLQTGPALALQRTPDQAELLGRLIDQIAEALRSIARHLRTGDSPAADPRIGASIERLLAELEQSDAPDAGSRRESVARLVKTKIGVLRSIQDLLVPGHDVPLACARDDLRRYITPDEWRFAAVTANLRPDAPVFRHAARTCITAGAAYALTRVVPWAPHPQWIVLTITAVMQGSLAQTLLRRNARVIGTLLGCLVVVLLTTNSSVLFLSACFLVASGIAHAFFGVRYSVTAGAAAVMAVLQAHLVAPASGFSTLERFVDTVAGALLGWAATYALPTWERKSLPKLLQQAVDALRAYAVEATALRGDLAGLPRFSRQRAYDAIRALGAIRSRSLAEPEDVRVPVAQLASWLAAAYALMSHLSNLRLALTLHAREEASPALATAMAAVTRSLDATLGTRAVDPASPPSLDQEVEHALTAVPHLATRTRRALEDAARIAGHTGRVEAMIRPAANDAP